MKKTAVLLMVIVCIFALAGCGNTKTAKYTIGICQYVQHDALDKATEGFMQAVKDGLGEENVEFELENASGEYSACSSIISDFTSKNVDLIMANATPALQAAVSATDSIPILGTSVTHYAPALDISIEDWTGTVGGNVSGTSDLADLAKQAKMIVDWFPETKKVAMLYCSQEANSVFQIEEMKKYLSEYGIESKAFSFTDTNDAALVTGSACDYADVIYVPTDNTAAANAEAIANVVLERNIPVITGETGTCKGCGIATLSIDYYDLGYTTGKMAVKVLTGEEDISKMPIEYAPEITAYYNSEICKHYNITPLDGYIPIE